MATDKMLFHVDQVVVDGQPQPFEDSTGVLTGAGRWENTVVPGSDNEDFQSRRRVPTTFAFKLLLGPNQSVDDLARITDAQITARDKVGNRRAMMPRCSFASMGAIGSGSVDVTFNVLSPIQWL